MLTIGRDLSTRPSFSGACKRPECYSVLRALSESSAHKVDPQAAAPVGLYGEMIVVRRATFTTLPASSRQRRGLAPAFKDHPQGCQRHVRSLRRSLRASAKRSNVCELSIRL